MTYKIFEDGTLINRIVAGEEFCETYCRENGYTYEWEPGPQSALPQTPTYTADDLLSAFFGLESNI